MFADAGDTVATSGFTVRVATFEKSMAVQGPLINARNWYPLKFDGVFETTSVPVVAPENGPPFVTVNHGPEALVLYSHP